MRLPLTPILMAALLLFALLQLLSSCAVTTIENRYTISGNDNKLTCPNTAGADKRSTTDFGLSAAASQSGQATNSGSAK